ncbi:dipicolinate synthase subunit B [Proteinivorax hydrogeniformans]|uniref:Dipicolinate synthase subunit B n=1 Tax=Proteinivorax hydrogeniformans TaxID=1826727 RepID=A0AAU8HPH3_9FIRM
MLKGKKIGVVITGSHCTLEKAMIQLKELKKQGAELFPIISSSMFLDTRFGKGSHWIEEIKEITQKPVISGVVEAEPIGPNKFLDILIVIPCTGNTLAKLANAITDNGALMAIKAHLRNNRPVVLAVSTNDGLSQNASNIARLITHRNIFFVPFGQDNPQGKPFSLVANLDKVLPTIEKALSKNQVQPILIEYKAKND